MDGFAIVDKAQWESLHKENERLQYLVESLEREASLYETAFYEADSDAKEAVRKQMADLRAENARLRRELVNANNEFDRVTGWGFKK